ncbi:leucine rich repeat protein [Leptospira kirschneri str. JB]|nr:leucine rich repeat protein [Leptospira kirschneri str. JB]
MDLYKNKLTTLPKEIGQLQNLQDLDLLMNPLSFKERKRIQKLFPNCNLDLREVAKDGDYRNLNLAQEELLKVFELSLEYKDFSHLFPKVILKFRNLQSLYLYDCGFPTLPKEIGRLENL